ncbi:MAG: methionine--tRNA ligase [Bdellovibrionota bacterium]
MKKDILVTAALPYANGAIHIGHILEYIQADIWVRFQKMALNNCLYCCADDTHGTPIMLKAKEKNISPEELIAKVSVEHQKDFSDFLIEFDNYHSTHSPENKELVELFYNTLNKKGHIEKREIEQAYDEQEKMFLPDRFIKGTCPKCNALEQYGDSCEACGATYSPLDMKDAVSVISGKKPVKKLSMHYFFKITDFEDDLKELLKSGFVDEQTVNKMKEWFKDGLKDWDISRDAPYFGFKIPNEEDKYFYVWLDAPIGYIASLKNYCDKRNIDYKKYWTGDTAEVYHFIGKDIAYFHTLFWQAALMGVEFNTPKRIFIHGFITVNGQKMSKSRGTFISARTYLNNLNPEYLRYYYASKINGKVEDIDLNFEDFVAKVNSDLVGNLVNIISRSAGILGKHFDNTISTLNIEGKELLNNTRAKLDVIKEAYLECKYMNVVKEVLQCADEINKFYQTYQPWVLVKEDKEKACEVLTAGLNVARCLIIYLKPILPALAKKVEGLFNESDWTFKDLNKTLENIKLNEFERLMERIDIKDVEKMVEDTKKELEEINKVKLDNAKENNIKNNIDNNTDNSNNSVEPILPRITYDDFAKIDLRIATVLDAEIQEDSNKLLKITLDIGVEKRQVFAGIKSSYDPKTLIGKKIIMVANLEPRKMKFGISDGMILASGTGEFISVVTPDKIEAAKNGDKLT